MSNINYQRMILLNMIGGNNTKCNQILNIMFSVVATNASTHHSPVTHSSKCGWALRLWGEKAQDKWQRLPSATQTKVCAELNKCSELGASSWAQKT
jgi:hypothetical protein